MEEERTYGMPFRENLNSEKGFFLSVASVTRNVQIGTELYSQDETTIQPDIQFIGHAGK